MSKPSRVKKKFKSSASFIKERLNNSVLLIISLIYTNVIIWLSFVLFTLDLKSQWLLFFIWLLSLTGLFIIFLKGTKIPHINKHLLYRFIAITLLALLTRFFYLDDYPFPTIGDMVRDGGWDAAKLARGEIENIFGYCRYQSHSYIISTLLIPLHALFGDTDMTFKAGAALISILDIWVVFFIGEFFFKKNVGFWASLILIASHLHLFYARTEIVVISSSIIVSILILSLLSIWKSYSLKKLLIISLLIGFSFNFHSAIKPVAFLVLGFSSLIACNHYIKEKSLMKIIFSMICVIIFILIGFGPRFIYTTPDIFLNTKRITVTKDDPDIDFSTKVSEKYKTMSDNYQKSLMIYFYEDSQSHYAYGAPLVPFSFGLFFIYAIVEWIRKRRSGLILIPFFFLIPFTNSAITDIINADHRTTLLLSFTSLAVASGFVSLYNFKISNTYTKLAFRMILIFFISINLLWSTFTFFDKEYANKTVKEEETTQVFLLTYASELLNKDISSSNVCINSSETNYKVFDLMHFKEQFLYTNPDKTVELNILDSLMDEEKIYITNECVDEINEADYVLFSPCEKRRKFVCPKYSSNLNIFIHKKLN